MDNQQKNTPQSPREQLKTQTRRRLVESGTRAFAKLGYHGMKIAVVAREAGVANGTFYLHFKDKQALFLEILRSAVSKLASAIISVHGYGETDNNSEREELAVVFDFAENNRDLMRIALNTDSSELLQGVDIFAPIVEIRTNELKKAIAKGALNRGINPLIAARAEIGMMMTVILWWQDNKDKSSRQEVIETLALLRRSWAIARPETNGIDTMLAQWNSKL